MKPKEREPKSLRFSTSAKNRPKPLQSKPAFCALKHLQAIVEESIKDKTSFLVDENFESSKNGEEQVEYSESESSYSSKSKVSKKDKETQNGINSNLSRTKVQYLLWVQRLHKGKLLFNQKRNLLRISPLMKVKKRRMTNTRKKKMTVKKSLSKLNLRNQLS